MKLLSAAVLVGMFGLVAPSLFGDASAGLTATIILGVFAGIAVALPKGNKEK